MGDRTTQLTHPPSAAFTAAMRSLINTSPLWSASALTQVSYSALPSAMFTAAISSLIETMPSPLQSPLQPKLTSVGVGVGVESGGTVSVIVGVESGGTVAVIVGVAVRVGVEVAVEPGGTVAVCEGVPVMVGDGSTVRVRVTVGVCVGLAVGVLDTLASVVGLRVGVLVGAATVDGGVGLGVASGTDAVRVGVVERVVVGDGDVGAVVGGVVADEVLVAVDVGVATDSGANQKPPCTANAPPVSVAAAGCPMVPPSSYAPPVLKVAPPPAITLCERSNPPPVCASATAGRHRSAASTVRMRAAYGIAAPLVRSTDKEAGTPISTG